jgi:hypothetical protein
MLCRAISVPPRIKRFNQCTSVTGNFTEITSVMGGQLDARGCVPTNAAWC